MHSHEYHFFFFIKTPATTEIYTLSLHDALPICGSRVPPASCDRRGGSLQCLRDGQHPEVLEDRKSTRLNSSHSQISYAVFCLKKKKYHRTIINIRSLCYGFYIVHGVNLSFTHYI